MAWAGSRALLAAVAILISLAAAARADADLLILERVSQEMAKGNDDAGFALLEDAIKDPDNTAREQVDLLAELARLRTLRTAISPMPARRLRSRPR